MPSKDFNRLVELTETRRVLQLPGDMIFAVLKLDQVSDRAVSAIRVAQAAEHVAQLASQAASFAASGPQSVRVHCERESIFPSRLQAETIFTEADFESIGAPDLPQTEMRAKALEMAAQLYLNNEIQAIRDAINDPADVGGALSLGADAASGFRSVAKGLLLQSAETLRQEGHADLARKVAALGWDIRTAQVKIAPYEVMAELLWNHHKGNQNLMTFLSDPRYLDDEGPYIKALEKLRVVLNPRAAGASPLTDFASKK